MTEGGAGKVGDQNRLRKYWLASRTCIYANK